MTKKVQEQEQKNQAAIVQASDETGQGGAKLDQPEPTNDTESKETGEAKGQEAKPEHPEPVVKSELFNLSELASKRRIPGWQQAALLRLMAWQKDKLVTEAEYDAALKALGQRRLGGGRM